MAKTYELIKSTVLTTATNSVTLSSISSSYTDLRLVIFLRGNSGTVYAKMRFNGDATNSYGWGALYNNGTTLTNNGTVTSSSVIPLIWQTGASTAHPSSAIADIFLYSNSNYAKNVYVTSNEMTSSSGNVRMQIASYRSLSSISEINIIEDVGNSFGVGSRFEVYGILRA
jgi:hypothetical protein